MIKNVFTYCTAHFRHTDPDKGSIHRKREQDAGTYQYQHDTDLARITDKKVGHEMGAFAGSVKKMDMKPQCQPGQEEVTVEGMLKSLKISTGKASDVILENLAAKVWGKLSTVEHHAFVSEVKDRENSPKTFRDFQLFSAKSGSKHAKHL